MSAELFNFYGNMQLEYVSFRIVASSNLTSPPLTDVDTSVIISTLADGDYSATYEWTMKVTAAVGDTIPSASQFNDQNQNFNVSATVNQVVTDHVFGGTITSTPSNPTPPAGALVTLTITISGSGPANATLAVDTSFTATQLAVEAFRSVSSTNLGTPSHLSGNDFDLITAPIESGGSYTATFEIDLRVATSVANGTAISITSNLGEENGSVVNSAVATLIAAAAPGGLEPISPATKTPAPQPTATTPYEPTPVPGVPSAPGDKEPPAAPVKALPTTGGGSGAGAGAMLSLLLAGVFAGLAAFIIGRRPVAKR